MERETLSEKTAERIIALIRDSSYAPGDRLPTEAQLVELTGAGRNTVREALRMLASRNVLVIRQGSGCFLSARPGVTDDPLGLALAKDPRQLTRDLLQLRIIIEPEIAALAAQNATAQDVEELEALLAQLRELVRTGSDFAANDQQFHTKLAECTHNQVMSRLLPVIAEGVHTFSDTVREPETVYTIKSHTEVVEAVRGHRPSDAREAMLYHLLYNKRRFCSEE